MTATTIPQPHISNVVALASRTRSTAAPSLAANLATLAAETRTLASEIRGPGGPGGIRRAKTGRARRVISATVIPFPVGRPPRLSAAPVGGGDVVELAAYRAKKRRQRRAMARQGSVPVERSAALSACAALSAEVWGMAPAAAVRDYVSRELESPLDRFERASRLLDHLIPASARESVERALAADYEEHPPTPGDAA